MCGDTVPIIKLMAEGQGFDVVKMLPNYLKSWCGQGINTRLSVENIEF